MSPRLGLYQRKQGSGSPKALGHGIRDQNGVAPGPRWPAAAGTQFGLAHPGHPQLQAWQLSPHWAYRPHSLCPTARRMGAGQRQPRKGSPPLLLPTTTQCSTVTLGPARIRAGGGDRWHG